MTRERIPRTRVAVVGNGVAGTAAARRLARSGRVEPILVGPGLPYDRPPLSKRALERGVVPWLADAGALEAEGIRRIDGHARDVDLVGRRLLVEEAGERRAVEFESLIWATGLAPWRPPVPGAGLAHDPQTADGMLALHAALAGGPRRVVVIGAGLVGAETAGTLARLGHDVTLVDAAARPLERLGDALASVAGDALRAVGVRSVMGAPLRAITASADAFEVRAGALGLPADVVVSAVGARSTLPPALDREATGIAEVDGHLRLPGVGGVHVVGDLAAVPDARHGRLRVPHWDHARRSAIHAAEAVLGEAGSPYVCEPYWFSDIAGLRIQAVGHLAAAGPLVESDGMLVGHAADGLPACAVLVDAPTRLSAARALLAGARAA